jgi:hypothetical protein
LTFRNVPGPDLLEKVLLRCEEGVCYRWGSCRAPPAVRGAVVRKTVYAQGRVRGVGCQWGENTYRNLRSILLERRWTGHILGNPGSGMIGVKLTLTLVLYRALWHRHHQQSGYLIYSLKRILTMAT